MRQRYLRIVVLLAGLLCTLALTAPQRAQAPVPATTAPSAWQGPFFFIQLTDPQLGMFASDKDFAKETELLGKAIDAANRLKPAFVIVTGDLVNKTGDAAQIAEFKRLTGKLDKSILLYLVAGNHDVQNNPTTQSLAHYREAMGADWYAFDIGGCHFIVLNSSLIGHPENAQADFVAQRAWMEKDLAAADSAKPRHTVVFMHHPLFVSKVDEKDSYNSIPTTQRAALLDQFKQHSVEAVFTGHLHHSVPTTMGAIQMFSAGPVGKPLGKDPSGMCIVKVREGAVEYEYVGLDQVPEKVDLRAPVAAPKP